MARRGDNLAAARGLGPGRSLARRYHSFPTEGWLNLLLPLAWACLAALAVLEEPLVGDRNFWTTRPHRWTALLGAKLAFVALAIHVPALAADVYVLAARGFPPVPYAGGLLWKQLLLFGAVTLPALALATLVRNFAHFVIAIFGIAALLAVLNGGLSGYPDFDRPVAGQLRHGLVRLVLAAVGIAVIAIQYARRRALGARVVAVAGALAAVLLSTWLPVQAGYSFGSAANLKIALRDAMPDGALLRTARSNGAPTALLPIAISGNPPGEQFFGYPVAGVEITTMDGARIESVRSSPNRPFEKVPLMAWTYTSTRDAAPEWLVLRFSAPAWERVKNRPVRIRGWLAIQYFRYGDTTMLPPGFHKRHGSRPLHGNAGGRPLLPGPAESAVRIAARSTAGDRGGARRRLRTAVARETELVDDVLRGTARNLAFAAESRPDLLPPDRRSRNVARVAVADSEGFARRGKDLDHAADSGQPCPGTL